MEKIPIRLNISATVNTRCFQYKLLGSAKPMPPRKIEANMEPRSPTGSHPQIDD